LTAQSFVAGELLQLPEVPFEAVEGWIPEKCRLEELMQVHQLRVLLAVVLSLVTDREAQVLAA
jgi:hypothetical protein